MAKPDLYEIASQSTKSKKEKTNPFGETWKQEYIDKSSCTTCERTNILVSKYNGTCVICDNIMTEKEYLAFESKTKEKEVSSMFEEPKTKKTTKKEKPTQPKEEVKEEPTKYPLEKIEIDRSQLTLTEAKEKILEEIELYNFTIENVVNEKDFANIKGKLSICKSGVRKIQLALNISTEIVSNEVWKEGKEWVAKYIVKAIAPSGRTATCVGVCEQFEKGRERTRHDTEATAQTRATSRAILDLAGFGAVSATEIDDSKDSGGMFE